MAKQRTLIGQTSCLCCKRDIPVRAADNGTLNLSCTWCDFSAYAKAGTEAHKLLSKLLPAPEAPGEADKSQDKPSDTKPAAQGAPAAKPAAKAPPKPAKPPAAAEPRKGGFAWNL